jgi:hypothetical protein
MVLLDGNNFGNDTSLIKVYFNAKEARVITSTGTRILALVPRLPGDTCIVSVEIGGHKLTYDSVFCYKTAATVTTIAGNGSDALVTTSLDKSQLKPIYIGADKDFNIFVTHEGNVLLRINEAENSITVLATGPQGFNSRCQPYAHPITNVLQFGSEGSANWERFLLCDPKEGWVPKVKFITKWDLNGYVLPNVPVHYHCLYCEADGFNYTRYTSGQIVRINTKTWEAKIIGMTPTGINNGMAFHPFDKTVLWIGMNEEAGVCTFDVTDPNSYQQLSSGVVGHRDGTIYQARFNSIRQVNFDPDGNLFIGDSGNHCIRKLDTQTMMVETIVGIPGAPGFQDGSKEDAKFNYPHGIATDANGIVYVSDWSNCRVRRIAIE